MAASDAGVIEVEAHTADGVTLRIDRVPARGERRGVVVCLHAMMTDGRYFGARRPREQGSFAAYLADRGLDVYVADFRGHGRSVPPRAGSGNWSFDDLVERDLPAIITAVAAASSVPPGELGILGHSLGGLVASAALGTGRIDAPRVLGLAATNVWLGETPTRRALMRLYRGATVLLGKAPIRALRLGNADEAVAFVDQLTGWSRSRRWLGLLGVDYLAALETITAPAFAFTGARDRLCPPPDARAFARRIPTCAPLRCVGRRFGDPLDPDHFQLFTRPELVKLRDEVVARFIAT